jgi:hypothetical protein
MRRRALGAALMAAIVFAFPAAESLAQNKKKGDAGKPKAETVDSAKLPAREYVGKVGSVPGPDRVFTLEMESKSVVVTGANRNRINYKTTSAWTEVEFQASEKVRVRTKLLPEQFDEKGNLKKYTSKQLAELRGKDSQGLPGYESSLDKLAPGQTVSVQLAPAKVAAKGKDKDDAAAAEKKMQVRLIVILAEPSGGEGRAVPKKKK